MKKLIPSLALLLLLSACANPGPRDASSLDSLNAVSCALPAQNGNGDKCLSYIRSPKV